MNKMLFFSVLFLQLFVPFKGLENSDMDNENMVVPDRVLANLLKLCPENIVISGAELTLDTYLWRDFIPTAEENGKSLTCSIRFVGQKGDILSNNISISKVYVVNNKKIWTCDFFEKGIAESGTFEIVVKNGPEWGPDIDVDVICEFKNQKQSFRLISKSQNINVIY